MKIIMTTHARTPSYVSGSLHSLFANESTPLDVRLIVHERDPSFLSEFWREHPHVSIRTLTAEEDAVKKKLGARVRVAHATRIALEDAGEECLVFQDDVRFAANWFSRFQRTCLRDNRSKTMVALYSPVDTTFRGLARWQDKYWGLCAMYFGDEARKAAIEALDVSGKVKPLTVTKNSDDYMNISHRMAPGADVRLAWMLQRRRDIELFAVYPSLVQHIGHNSSIGSKTGSHSPTFGQDDE